MPNKTERDADNNGRACGDHSNEDDRKKFLIDNKWLICSLIVEGVKKSLEEGLQSIVIFRLINTIDDFIM